MRLVKSLVPAPQGDYVAFALLTLASASYYSQNYVVGLQSTNVELFSAIFMQNKFCI